MARSLTIDVNVGDAVPAATPPTTAMYHTAASGAHRLSAKAHITSGTGNWYGGGTAKEAHANAAVAHEKAARLAPNAKARAFHTAQVSEHHRAYDRLK
jgi:hypothetical protein